MFDRLGPRKLSPINSSGVETLLQLLREEQLCIGPWLAQRAQARHRSKIPITASTLSAAFRHPSEIQQNVSKGKKRF